MTPQELSIADLKAMPTEEKMLYVQNSKEITEAVKLLVAAFRDCDLKSYIRFEFLLPDTNEYYELTFLKLNKQNNTPPTEPKNEEK